jgi:hypothetical protein
MSDSITYKPIIEVIESAQPNELRAVRGFLAVATLAALLLGSRQILGWTQELPVSALSDLLLGLAQGWHDLMRQLGLAQIADGARAALRSFQTWH